MKFGPFIFSFFIVSLLPSCTSVELVPGRASTFNVPDIPEDPNRKATSEPPPVNRKLSSSEPLITYCATDTGPASTLEEKHWRDAFSLEVIERICNKEPEVAKPWRGSRYLESSWAHGINLTGVDNGVPRGTAITSRHVIYTKHYGFHGQVGQEIWFLTVDNRWVSRKIVAVKYLDNADVAIARLDSDLPGSITPLKVLDPEAFKLIPDKIPVLRIQQNSKALIVTRRRNSLWPPADTWDWPYKNPAELAYAQYYQGMIRFDSSSPSILLLRNEYGVMPILYGLVTWSGPGDGPQIHTLLSEIQSAIQSFGDSHQLEKAMPPVTPHAAPSCSILAKRSKDGQSCELKIQASADPVTGNPTVTPISPSSWSVNKNVWTGNVACSSDASTVFEATLTGPGGTGRTCESGPVGPVLPQCDLTVNRRGSSEVCDVSVTRLLGNPTSNPVLTPNNPSDWIRSGDNWTGTTSCALTTPTSFSAWLTDEQGQGPACTSNLQIFSEVPTCEVTSRRVDYSDTCEVTVTRKSGVVSGTPTVTPRNPSNWTQTGDKFTGTTSCPINDYTTFFASLSGPLGTGPVCKSPSILEVPKLVSFCELQAVRQGLTNVCKLTARQTRGLSGGSPVASSRNPTNWTNIPGTLTWEGTVTCSYNGPHQFSAYIDIGKGTPGQVCKAPIVEKIPAPACTLEVIRLQNMNKCNFTLSAGSVLGTISSYNFNGETTRTAWNGLDPIKGQWPCSQVADTTFNASVWGVGGVPQTGTCSAQVAKLTPPSCQLTARRRARSSTCDLALVSSGVIDANKSPRFSTSVSGRWSGYTWRGTGSCGIKSFTTFSASVFGPGGSKGVCTSNRIPKL
ncbi:MAG: hypothetical protein EBQ92_03980 [Proteobacteria bacterium]|nr:hypothetical protein [Pseudomonadota bacterium]